MDYYKLIYRKILIEKKEIIQLTDENYPQAALEINYNYLPNLPINCRSLDQCSRYYFLLNFSPNDLFMSGKYMPNRYAYENKQEFIDRVNRDIKAQIFYLNF